jgi:dethiobiotin synthetase
MKTLEPLFSSTISIPPHVFVTGTDTGIGKTHVCVHLLKKARRDGPPGCKVVGMKPVAAGVERQINGEGGHSGMIWANEDVLALKAASSYWPSDATLTNPVLLREPVSPHIAAAQQGLAIDLAQITRAFKTLAGQADRVVVEGAGGFCVPLSGSQDGSHLAQALSLPVLLVVGMRLGCLNHARLTAQAVLRSGLKLCAWVANVLDPHMPALAENVTYLDNQFNQLTQGGVPRLALFPYERSSLELQFLSV